MKSLTLALLIAGFCIQLQTSCSSKTEKTENTTESSTSQNTTSETPEKENVAQTTWNGSYSYDENLGENNGGTPISYIYMLEFYTEGEKTMAKFNTDGFQTMERIICSVNNTGENTAELVFENFGEEDLFKSRYKKGDKVTTISQTDENNLEFLLTDASLKEKKVIFKKEAK